MNKHDPWLNRQVGFPARLNGRGWSVEFAVLDDGSCPALDYLKGCDAHSEKAFRASDKHLDMFTGIFRMLNSDGISKEVTGKFFKTFKGDDAGDSMCEAIVVPERGHRLLGFLLPGQVVLFTNGFRKPPQRETPPEQKLRARNIKAVHDRRVKSKKKPKR